MAGATAVQVGTASLGTPGVGLSILKGLERFMLEANVPRITELVGAAHDRH